MIKRSLKNHPSPRRPASNLTTQQPRLRPKTNHKRIQQRSKQILSLRMTLNKFMNLKIQNCGQMSQGPTAPHIELTKKSIRRAESQRCIISLILEGCHRRTTQMTRFNKKTNNRLIIPITKKRAKMVKSVLQTTAMYILRAYHAALPKT